MVGGLPRGALPSPESLAGRLRMLPTAPRPPQHGAEFLPDESALGCGLPLPTECGLRLQAGARLQDVPGGQLGEPQGGTGPEWPWTGWSRAQQGLGPPALGLGVCERCSVGGLQEKDGQLGPPGQVSLSLGAFSSKEGGQAQGARPEALRCAL